MRLGFYTIAFLPLFLFGGCGTASKPAQEPANPPSRSGPGAPADAGKAAEPASNPASLSGKWTCKYGKDGIAEVTFKGTDRFTWQGKSWSPSRNDPKRMIESRGPLCEYEYRQTAEGVWTVTWLSRLVDGQETIQPHHKKPEEWKVHQKSKGEMTISKPSGQPPDELRKVE